MRKINSIGYGQKLFTVILIFLLAIPAPCALISYFTHIPAFRLAAVCSLGIGLLIALALAVLLSIELRQDKRALKQYEKENPPRH